MLYPHKTLPQASPKAISRRTSYIRARLEFLLYPQVIPVIFRWRLVRSSMKLYLHFNLPMDRSLGFGSASYYYIALFRLAFASAPSLKLLTSQHNATRRSVLQKVRSRTFNRASSACKHRVSGSLSLPSRGSFHLSLTVLYAIGHQPFLGLGGGPPGFPQDFTCPAVLWYCLSASSFPYRTVTFFGPAFLRCSGQIRLLFDSPQPRASVDSRFGLLPFRSPLLRESSFLSFPPGT